MDHVHWCQKRFFFWFKMRTNWWHWWTWHGNSKRRDEKEKNKRVMPLKALSSLHLEFIVKDSWQFLLLIKMTNMKFFFQLFWLWTWVEIISIKACLFEKGRRRRVYVVQNCIKKWVKISHMSNGIFRLEIFHFSYFSLALFFFSLRKKWLWVKSAMHFINVCTRSSTYDWYCTSVTLRYCSVSFWCRLVMRNNFSFWYRMVIQQLLSLSLKTYYSQFQ